MKNQNTNSTHTLKHYASLAGVFAGFVALAFFAQFGFSNLVAQAQTTGPVARQITGHTIYNDLPVEQNYIIAGQNLLMNDNWDLSNCAGQSITLSNDEIMVGVRFSGGGFVSYKPLGLAKYFDANGSTEFFKLPIKPNQSNGNVQYSEFYITKCYTEGSEISAPWKVSVPVSAGDDDIEFADPVRITAPAAGEQVVESTAYDIKTQIRTSAVGNVGDPLRVDYYLETTAGTQYYLGYQDGLTLQSGENNINYTWDPAGYTNDNSLPILGSAKIRSVVTIVNQHAIGNVLSGEFDIVINPANNGLIEILDPTEFESIAWGATNVPIEFRVSDNIKAVNIKLTRIATLHGGAGYSATLASNCATIPNQDRQSCTVNFPNPTDPVDGNYLLIVSNVDATNLPADIQPVAMFTAAATQDFHFDTSKGINGLEFNPLVFDITKEPQVEVFAWVAYENNTATEYSPDVTLHVTAGFGDTIGWEEVTNKQISVAKGIAAGQSRLVSLGSFKADANIFNYNLELDRTDSINETSETNNTLIGILEEKDPGINSGNLGVNLYFDGIGGSALKQGSPLDTLIGLDTGLIPAGALVGEVTFTINYDPSKLALSEDGYILPNGIAITSLDNSVPGMLKISLNIDPDLYDNSKGYSLGHIEWDTLAPGEVTLRFSSFTRGLIGDENDIFLQDENGVQLSQYGDVLGLMDPDSLTVNISNTPKPLAATYTSRYLPVTDSTHRITGLINFAAIYNDAVSPDPEFTSSTTFRIGFFDENKNNLCVGSCSPGFSNQFYQVNVSESYNPATEEGIVPIDDVNNLIQDTWTNQVKYLRIQVIMETSNHYGDATYQPWVEDIYLNYDSEALGEIGLISSTAGVINVAPGESTTYDFTVNLFNEPTFIGTVTWNVSLDQQDTNDVVVTPVGATTMTFDGTNPIKTGTVLVAVSPEALAGLNNYTFSITAVTSDATKTIRPLQNVQINVLGDSTSEFSIQVVPANTSGAVGSNVEFTVTAIRQTGFTDAIAITDNIQSIFGNDIESVTYQPANAIIPANSNGPVTITAAISPTAAFGTKDFTITGESSGINSGATVSLTISDGSDLKNATFTLNIPIQGGNDGIQPIFSFFLYSADNSKIFEKTDIKTQDQKATVNVNGLTIGGIYKSFVRSTRHLWRESDNTVTISASESNYTFNFTQLLAGDLDPNNVINAIDVPVLTRDWGKTGQGLIPDIDGNGAVNALDIVAIFSNYFKTGDQLPSNQ